MASFPLALARISSTTLLSGTLAACIVERLISHSEAGPSCAWPSLRLRSTTANVPAVQHFARHWSAPEQLTQQWHDGMLLGRGDPRTKRGKVCCVRRGTVACGSAC